MGELKKVRGSNFSSYRTVQVIENYAEFSSVAEFIKLRNLAMQKGQKIYILANGSNTLFTRRKVRTAILKNSLPREIRKIEDGEYYCSSSVLISQILKRCANESLASFYFLASVPATVGGALAMNAGLGVGKTIYDYVVSISYLDGDKIEQVPVDKVWREHRRTQFSGIQDKLIIGATFRFSKESAAREKLAERIRWSRENQDIKHANCGSVFRVYHPPIVKFIRGLPYKGIYWPILRCQYSQKVNNWIICNSKSSAGIVLIIGAVKFLHRIAGKKVRTEVIEVD